MLVIKFLAKSGGLLGCELFWLTTNLMNRRSWEASKKKANFRFRTGFGSADEFRSFFPKFSKSKTLPKFDSLSSWRERGWARVTEMPPPPKTPVADDPKRQAMTNNVFGWVYFVSKNENPIRLCGVSYYSSS